MIGSKAGAAGAKLSCSTKRKRDTKRVRGAVSGVSDSGDGGSGVSGEFDGVADAKFAGVRRPTYIVEIKNLRKGLHFYTTVKEMEGLEDWEVLLVAATVHDLARVYADPSFPEKRLNIHKVEHCIQKKARIEHSRIGKDFLVKFAKEHPLKLEVEQDVKWKEEIVKLSRLCFLKLKEITGDRERHVQGRQRKDLASIPSSLPENGVPQEDDRAHALKVAKDTIAKEAAIFAPANGKSLDAKDEAKKCDLITFFQGQLEILKPEPEPEPEPERAQWEGFKA